MISDLNQIGGRKLWIQIAMVGDPAWLWGSVIETELIDHVVVPVGVLVPLMTLAAFFTVRQTLRPLSRVASQAEALGRAVRAGRPLQPLSIQGLPREIVDVVVAINAMLDRLETSFLHQKQFTADVAHELRTPLAVLRLQVSDLPATAAGRSRSSPRSTRSERSSISFCDWRRRKTRCSPRRGLSTSVP